MKTDTTPTAVDFAEAEPKETALPELISPFPADLPPYPSTLRTIDVMREVEKVREARKRIRLGAEAYAPGAVESQLIRADGRKVNGQDAASQAAKPSVCLFTVHDAGDR
jgi:transcription initiation factor TFIID subunit 5